MAREINTAAGFGLDGSSVSALANTAGSLDQYCCRSWLGMLSRWRWLGRLARSMNTTAGCCLAGVGSSIDADNGSRPPVPGHRSYLEYYRLPSSVRQNITLPKLDAFTFAVNRNFLKRAEFFFCNSARHLTYGLVRLLVQV